jgi:lysophospholipase L1-like esterase
MSGIVFVGTLLGLELVGRVAVWFCGIPTEFTPEPFQGFGQTDPVLWWTLQPNLDIESQGVRVRTNGMGFRDERDDLPPDALRVFCLGDSTTYGWRVEADEMYSSLAERALGERLERPVSIVSAGVPGYTSYQVLEQFRERILPLRPDVVCVLASNNECRARAIGDRERGERLARTRAVERWLGFSHFWILISRAPESMRRGWEIDSPPGRVANTADEYRQNLAELIRLAREHNCRVVLMTVPIRLRFEPTWPSHDLPVPQVADLLRRAQQTRFLDEPPETQETLLKEAVRLAPDQFTAHWRLAQLYLELDRPSEAKQHFELARDGDLHPETAKPAYNRVLLDLSSDLSVPLVDLDQRFTAADLPTSELFLDHCHPSPAGHRIIAESLSKELFTMLARVLD